VIAAGRAISRDATSVTFFGRAFLVSQDFDGTALFPYIAREMAKSNAEILASGGIGSVVLPPIAARSKILSPPFEGIRLMAFVVRPPRPRGNTSERLLLSYHFVVRSGVSVQVAGGSADDEVQVIVSFNDAAYQPAPEPPSHDIIVPLEALQWQGALAVESILVTNPAAAPLLNQGIVTSRYDMPPPISAKDEVNVVRDLLITGGSIPGTETPEQPTDDSQPYPIYGWLRLGFAPSEHLSTDVAPGATAADTTVTFVAKSLDGRIFYDYAQLGQGGHGWVELEGNGRTNAAPAAAAIGTYLFVAVKGLDNNVYVNQGELGHPFVGWRASPNMQTDVAPALASGANNIIFVAKSLDGRIFYDYAQLGQGGHGWVELEGNGRTNAAPAAAAIGTYLFVAVKGLDGNIYLNQGQLGQRFVGWQLYGG
jgi:hypothetical protein